MDEIVLPERIEEMSKESNTTSPRENKLDNVSLSLAEITTMLFLFSTMRFCIPLIMINCPFSAM